MTITNHDRIKTYFMLMLQYDIVILFVGTLSMCV